MTADEQSQFDSYQDLRSKYFRALRDAEAFIAQATTERNKAASYLEQMQTIAKQLGFAVNTSSV